MAPKRATRSNIAPETTNTTSVTNAQLQAMINQGVTAALAARDANTNGVDSHNSGTGARRNERATRECTYPDFMKCQPLNFKGTEGVVELTQWIEKMETVFRISNCSVENQIKFSTCTLLGNALTWWNSHVEDSVWSKRYSEWCNENSHDKKPRPRDYTFKEWVKLKKGHLDISKSVRKNLFRLWVIDQFTEALDPDKDPLERCLDEYNWVFDKEIEQLADEYEIKILEKGQVLEEIWTKCKRARCKNKDWWYDYWYEDEEKTELGNEDYNPPMVHTETFEVTKYKFDNECSFICVNGENNETLSLVRKNGSRFRKMIMEEMKEVLRNDTEDSDNET
ncbi:hypothetical protein Tco_0674220 [Tanacetum coccineum]